MRFERLDLNLLAALAMLIEERSVSAAAKRLHLSQPAVSGALNRLREFFDDDLLVQSGRQMVLTRKAEELAGPVDEALFLIRTRITTPATFDPKNSDRTFKIVVSDYAFTVFLGSVLARIAREAPDLTFDILPIDELNFELLERGEADLLITIDSHVRGDYPTVELFEDEHSVICWSESKYAAGIDKEIFANAGHAICYLGPARSPAFSEAFYEEHKIERNFEVGVATFTLLPQAVVGTERLATMQRRYADYVAKSNLIKVHPLPFEMPKLREVAQWHPMRDRDPGLKWLIRVIQEEAACM